MSVKPGRTQVLEDYVRQEYPRYAQDWIAPVGLSAEGYKAARIILRTLIDIESEGEDFALYTGGGGGFYTPEQLDEMWPRYSEGSVLALIHEGGHHSKWLRDDTRRVQENLRKHGMYLETYNAVASGVYRRTRPIRGPDSRLSMERYVWVRDHYPHPEDQVKIEATIPRSPIGTLPEGTLGIVQQSTSEPDGGWSARVLFPGIGTWELNEESYWSWLHYITIYMGATETERSP